MEKGLCALLHKYRPYTEMDVSISEEQFGKLGSSEIHEEGKEKKKVSLKESLKNTPWIQNSFLLLTDKEDNLFIETEKQPSPHESLRFRPFHLPCVDKNQDNPKFS